MEKNYIRVRSIGEGAFGKAILVKRKKDDRYCVIKEVALSKMNSKDQNYAKKEVEILKKLQHPFIVRYYEAFESHNCLHLVMEFCDGGDLYAKINCQKLPFSEDLVLDWFAQLCLAIKYVHDRKIMHRDIKPQNIFLMKKDNTLKIGDFGVAKTLEFTHQLARTAIGTPYYVSPEIVRNTAYNNKSDIWAIGCVLYELLTLKHAFEANNMKQLYNNIKLGNVLPVSAKYSSELRTMLSAMFRKNPKDRPSVTALLKNAIILPKLQKYQSPDEMAALLGPQSPSPASVPSSRPSSAAKRGVMNSPRPTSANKRPTVASPVVQSPYAAAPGYQSASRKRELERLAAQKRMKEAQDKKMKDDIELLRKKQELRRMNAAREEGWKNVMSSGDLSSNDNNSQDGPYAGHHEVLNQMKDQAADRELGHRDFVEHKSPYMAADAASAGQRAAKAADESAEKAKKLVEDYWERKRLAANNRARGAGFGVAKVVGGNKPNDPSEAQYMKRLDEIRRQNHKERNDMANQFAIEQEERGKKIAALKQQAEERANKLKQEYEEQRQALAKREHQAKEHNKHSPVVKKDLPAKPVASAGKASIATPFQKTILSSNADTPSLSAVLNQVRQSEESVFQRHLHKMDEPISPSVENSFSVASSADDLAKKRKKEYILKMINQKGEPPSPEMDKKQRWVDRQGTLHLENLPLQTESPETTGEVESPRRNWQQPSSGILKHLANAPLCSETFTLEASNSSSATKTITVTDISTVTTEKTLVTDDDTKLSKITEVSEDTSDNKNSNSKLFDNVQFVEDDVQGSSKKNDKEDVLEDLENEHDNIESEVLNKTVEADDDEDLQEVEKSLRKLLENDDDESKTDASLSAGSTIREALTTGKFDCPSRQFLRTCSMPDLTVIDKLQIGTQRRKSTDCMDVEDSAVDGLDIDVTSSGVDDNDEDDDVVEEEDEDEDLQLVKKSMAEMLLKSDNSSNNDGSVPSSVAQTLRSQSGDMDEAEWDDDDGLPIDDPNEAEENVFQKSERLRAELEQHLGLDKLLQVYELAEVLQRDDDISDNETEKRIKAALGTKFEHLHEKILSLIFYDNAFST